MCVCVNVYVCECVPKAEIVFVCGWLDGFVCLCGWGVGVWVCTEDRDILHSARVYVCVCVFVCVCTDGFESEIET
jgi:hypothetical protein